MSSTESPKNEAAYLSLSRQKWPSTVARLRDSVQELRRNFAAAEPFPHVVIDGLFDDDLLDAIVAEFPDTDDEHWYTTKSPDGGERFAGEMEAVAGPLSLILAQRLSAQPFLDCLEAITGIEGLICYRPPTYLLSGSGTKFGVHVDGSRAGKTGLHRRFNLLLYLNRNWSESYAGDLELWSEDAEVCVKRIPPMFNRLVIQLNTETSYHGFPRPLRCPDGVFRRGILVRYFTSTVANGQRGAPDNPHFRPQDLK